MSALVILCRHGNTFATGDKVVMIGAGEDLPLTEEGLVQGEELGQWLARGALPISRVIAGPLKRTRQFAERVIIKAAPAVVCEVDERLKELDYGAWSGLSDAEIMQRFGAEALRAWREEAAWPAEANFKPSEEAVLSQCASLLDELKASTSVSVVVTSNGRLRQFGKLLGQRGGAGSAPAAVSTGAACVLRWSGSEWRVIAWNAKPAALNALSLT